MVGSLGECLVADAYGLELKPASSKGYDAVSSTGLKVEIKATQSRLVEFRSELQHTIVIKLEGDGTFEEAYNGPDAPIWAQFLGKPLPSNGQYQISLTRLRELSRFVAESKRLPRIFPSFF